MANKQNIPVALLQCNEGQIKGLPRNPRFIKDERFKALVKSLQDDPEMLDLRELIVYPHGKHFVVIGGNMRLRAGKELGFETMPCKVLPVDTPIEKLKAYVIKDNNAFGNDDFDLLANEWDTEFLEECGFDFGNFFDEEEGEGESNGSGNETKVEEDNFDEDTEPIVCRCKRGEVWQLGNHRVMCGDSTSAEDVEKLRGGVFADMVFTDPPYGQSYQSNFKKNKFDKIENDDIVLDIFPLLRKAVKGWVYICTSWKVLQSWLELFQKYYDLSNIVVWSKGGGGLGDLKHTFITDYELILVSNNGAELKSKRCGSVWEIPKDDVNGYVHPTQKPIKLPAKAIDCSTKEGGVVLDLFGGSGSTLIACEQLNRKCLMMEYEPHYCDVILARWEKLTGQTAVKIAD